jgi:hypothetical protein
VKLGIVGYLVLALAASVAGNCALGYAWWNSSAERRADSAIASFVNDGNGITVKAQKNALDACLFDKALAEADEQAVGEERDEVLAKLKAARNEREARIRKAYEDDADCAAWAAAAVCPAAAGLR